MNNIFKNFDWSLKSIAKAIGIFVLGIVALTVIISLVGFSLKTITGITNQGYNIAYPTMGAVEYGKGGGGFAMDEMSSRAIMPPVPGYTKGDDAEEYEVTEYYSSIKTRRLNRTCDIFDGLKAKDYVIFENASRGEEYCNYSFKVKNENAEEIAVIIENLDPDVFDENTYTIKSTLEGYENELEILKSDLSSVEQRLASVEDSYNDVYTLANKAENIDALVQLITNNQNKIDDLTQQKLNLEARIDRLTQGKETQEDRMNYTMFSVNIYEDLIFNWDNIKESWKYEARQLVDNINDVIQSISLRLISNIALLAAGILYLFIAIFLLKFVWIGGKKIWKWKK